jgi:hypothetical protein
VRLGGRLELLHDGPSLGPPGERVDVVDRRARPLRGLRLGEQIARLAREGVVAQGDRALEDGPLERAGRSRPRIDVLRNLVLERVDAPEQAHREGELQAEQHEEDGEPHQQALPHAQISELHDPLTIRRASGSPVPG